MWEVYHTMETKVDTRLSQNVEESDINSDKDKYYNLKAGAFLTSVGGAAAIAAFAATLGSARRHDPDMFSKGVMPNRELHESGVQLATRALKWGTVYAFAGTGIICAVIWKLSGASNMQEFKQKMGSILPRIPKNNPPQGRTEFEGLTDLLNYIANDYSVKKGPGEKS